MEITIFSAFISRLEERPTTHPVILHGCSVRVFLKNRQGKVKIFIKLYFMHMQIEILCLQLWTEDNGKIEKLVKMHSRSGQSNFTSCKNIGRNSNAVQGSYSFPLLKFHHFQDLFNDPSEFQSSRYIFKPGCQYRIPTGQFPLFPPNHY